MQEFFTQYGFFLWLITLALVGAALFWIYRIQEQYNHNFKRLDALLRRYSGGEEGLVELFQRLGRLEGNAAELDKLQGSLRDLELAQKRTFQSVGMVRFNPFTDMGGDQSFALSVLDSYGDGFVMSSLHGRAATRLYAKIVRKGTATQQVSDEEQSAINQALRYQQMPPDRSSAVQS